MPPQKGNPASKPLDGLDHSHCIAVRSVLYLGALRLSGFIIMRPVPPGMQPLGECIEAAVSLCTGSRQTCRPTLGAGEGSHHQLFVERLCRSRGTIGDEIELVSGNEYELPTTFQLVQRMTGCGVTFA